MAETIALESSVWINAPRERVWNAITDEKMVRQWWGQDHWEIPMLQVGATIKFGDTKDLMTATIEVVDPPREFSLLWPPQQQYHNVRMMMTYLLEEENNGTRLTVRETGYEGMSEDIRQKAMDSTSKGYTIVLNSLKELLERT